MSEKEKQDSKDLATLLKELSKEDRLQIQGVIAGMVLARKTSPPILGNTGAERPRA